MFAPTGIGVLYGKKKLLETLQPFQYGGGMIQEVTLEKTTWKELPWKFEAGTPNIEGAIGLAKEIKDRAAVISFTLEGLHPHDVGEILNQEGIAIRGGNHCAMPLMTSLKINGTNRASFHIYNNKQDIDALVKAIQKAQDIFK